MDAQKSEKNENGKIPQRLHHLLLQFQKGLHHSEATLQAYFPWQMHKTMASNESQMPQLSIWSERVFSKAEGHLNGTLFLRSCRIVTEQQRYYMAHKLKYKFGT